MPSLILAIFKICMRPPLQLAFAIFCIGLIGFEAHAQCNVTGPTCTLISNGATSSCITAFSPNQTVTNATGSTVMVPHSTQTEWDSFRTNLPTSVTLGTCASFGAMNWTDCTCSNSSSCQCFTNIVTIVGSGTLYFQMLGGTAHYSYNSGAYTSASNVSLVVTNGSSLTFRFTLPCFSFSEANITIRDSTALGTIIDEVNGRNTDFSCPI